ncbi:MAG: reverse transcriptase [Spirochaetia bacterium]|nr:reverse transcriptase [Spirochaetia bacterium]
MENVKATVCDFDNLYKAMNKCKKGVTWKDSVSRYVNNGLVSVLKLQKSLEQENYKIDEYYNFTIHEPKKREIVSTKFKDRVFQRSLCDNYLYHQVVKGFIYDNGACQINKGTSFARDRLKVLMRRYYRKNGNEGYVLKCDFKDYFGSTPHTTAKSALQKTVDDKWSLGHAYDIINSYDNGDEIGLGLGSQITQLVQLLVLNDLDHYLKENLSCKYYLRYMDDLIIIHNDKEYLKKCLKEVDSASQSLGLSLNRKKTQIFKISQGINFLGFKFNLSFSGSVYCLLLKENVKKRRRKFYKYKNLVLEGKMTKEKADECYESWKAHAENGDSYNLISKMNINYKELWES